MRKYRAIKTAAPGKITELTARHPFYNVNIGCRGIGTVNSWRIIGLGSLVVLQALSGQTFARESRLTVNAPAAEEPAMPDKSGPAFTEDEQRRLRELRQWLLRRHMERKRNEPGGIEALKEAAASDLRAPANRPARRFPDGQHRETPMLHIGRGPDGRIHHRYVFSASGPDESRPASPIH
jgi:hypothetical protein